MTKDRKVLARSDSIAARMPDGSLASGNFKRAQIINYSELQKLLVQNIKKTTSRTYIPYTKENIQSYLQNPLANLDNIRLVSQFLYRVSSPYKIIINYFAGLGTYSYNVTYHSDLTKGSLEVSEFIKDYQTLLLRLENMRLKDALPAVVATALRDGAFFGFCYDNEKSFFISTLDPKYCKVSSIQDGVCNFAFNASYFDQGNNKYYIDAENNPDGLWDQAFIDGYNAYKAQGRDFMWFELPPEKSICIIAGDDPICPLPYFVSVFVDMLDLLDYQSLVRDKTELENTVLLLSKIPMIKNTEEVNAFSVDLDLVQATQATIDENTPSLVGTAYSPCEVTPIFFKNSNQVEDTNIYANALSNLMSNIGLSEMLFNPNKGGSVGLNASIKTDELTFYRFLHRIESWLNRYLTLNITEDFLLAFHRVTYFSRNEYADKLKEAATLGLPVKMDYATALGFSPLQILQQGYFENALGLSELWVPLSSSYNGAGSGQAGAPVKADGELTDEGADSRDAGKNEGTKAKKELNTSAPKRRRGRPRKERGETT